MTERPLIVIAAGGTGGHMFPAQALAEALLARGWRVRLSTDARGARYTDGFPDDVEISTLASATFARGGVLARILVPLRIVAGIAGAVRQMLGDRPGIVVGFGGYPTIPALGAAWLLRIPRMIHEQNGVLGRVNRLFASRVNRVACGTWPTELPAGIEGAHTGNPVRQAILDHAGSAYTIPEEGPLRILVIGGSQGARILSDIVPGALGLLAADLRARLDVSHQARSEDADRVRAAYAEQGIAAEVAPFFGDVPERIAASQLVISRAGASSVADLCIIGRPAILIPYAAATGDHQSANARGMKDAGAALVVPESALAPDALSRDIAGILSTPEKARDMARAAMSISRPDATDRLVALVELLKGQNAK